MKKRIAVLILACGLTGAAVSGCGKSTQTESGAMSTVASAQCADTDSSEAETSDPAGTADAGAADESISSGEQTITVSGTGTVTVVPDVAQISLGVQTQDKSTKAAQSENTRVVNKVIAALEKAGVEEKNITTSGLDIYANYDYSGSGSGDLTGYTVTTTLQLANLSVDDVGSLIDVATDAGVNQVNGISYSYSDSVTAYDQALNAALERAEEKAQNIAQQKGRTLGSVRTIEESSSSYDTPVDSKASGTANAAEDSMQVLAGESDVSATVKVTYYFQ